MSKNKFLIDKYDNLRVDIKMYMSEISKFKISDQKPQKMTILWTLKHVSAISKYPVNSIIGACQWVLCKVYFLYITLVGRVKTCTQIQ